MRVRAVTVSAPVRIRTGSPASLQLPALYNSLMELSMQMQATEQGEKWGEKAFMGR